MREPATSVITVDHPVGWWQDGLKMAEAEKTEKITLNLGLVDLGQIDLLVREGFYANRTDFLRTAVRAQLAVHSDALKRTVERKTIVLGLENYTRQQLEDVRAAGRQLQIRVLGLVTIADDVTPELALATIESVEVLGALRASPAVKTALRDRIR
jgi:Arc/MetJ-type ribon-helix-helix transcriptional regulator